MKTIYYLINSWRLAIAYLMIVCCHNREMIIEEMFYWGKCSGKKTTSKFKLFSSLLLEMKQYRNLLYTRLYCRLWNYTRSTISNGLRAVTAGREFHRALKTNVLYFYKSYSNRLLLSCQRLQLSSFSVKFQEVCSIATPQIISQIQFYFFSNCTSSGFNARNSPG